MAQSFPPYVQELLDHVQVVSGKPLRVTERRGIGYDSLLQVAAPLDPWHTLEIVPEYRDHRVHFIVSACTKILRCQDDPERLVPTYEVGRWLPDQDHADLTRRLQGLTREQIGSLSRFLYHGLVRQLTSMPTDLRVERELFETLDQHHLAQRSYLDRQLEDIEPHFHRSLAEVAPERLYRASSAMNVALAEEAASIIGFLPNERIRSSPHYQLGRELRDILRSELEEGCPGDRKITNTWATNLGLAGWYQWRAR